MANYSTSYDITQGGDLFAIQDKQASPGTSQYGASKGTTVQSPLNYRKLVAFKNIDNEFYFFVKNQDRKPIKLHGMEVTASFVDRRTKSRIFAKKCQTIDPDAGSLRLIINPGDISTAEIGNYDLVLTYKDGRGLNLTLYADVNYRPNLICEISDSAHAVPLTTTVVDTWIHNDATNYHVSERTEGPHYYHKRNGLITFGVHCTGYSGNVYLQGSQADYPDETDWYNIELSAVLDYYAFTSFTGIEPFSKHSNCKWLRVQWSSNGSGTVDKVTFRI